MRYLFIIINDKNLTVYNILAALQIHKLATGCGPQPVAKIKTGRVSQPITDAADATGRDRSWNATRPL